MDKTFNPKTHEAECYARWESQHYFSPAGEGPSFCVLLPPPNITGSLHMGHGFQQTLMDALIRYRRMLGDKTLWQGGTDHAGIATQMVVERQLQAQGQPREALGREKFVEAVYTWKEQSGGKITQQMRRLGASIDWQRERFTLDAGMSAAVTEVFIRLYQEGLIYRGTRLVNWDAQLQTAISDLEVFSQEESGFLYHIAYPLVEGTGYCVVATTRPETLFGDSALAVHPEDIRYQHLIGKHVRLPLTERTIPIIADTYVDPAFGSGCVKITPAHDFNDYVIGERHHLPLYNILTKTAQLNDSTPLAYRGLSCQDARQKVLATLQQQQSLVKQEVHLLKIPRGDRSGVVIEPYLTEQWYLKMDTLAAPALTAVRTGNIKIVPEHWTKTYYQWLENIQDWCISRQLWWGHRIPAWYDSTGNIYVGRNEAEVRKQHHLPQETVLTQESDVLDTWFSSALWPFSTLGWPEKTIDLRDFYPSQVLITGFDILFFWVARMVMLGMHFMDGQIPFATIYITGLIRDAEGHKMSKTKGNVLDPIDLIDGISLAHLLEKRTQAMMQPQLAEKIRMQTQQQFPQGIPASGCDALRFTFCALAAPTNNIRFDVQRLEGYRNFSNKLWNAARYVLLNVDVQSTSGALNTIDQWLMSRLHGIVQKTHQYYAQLRFDYLAHSLYDFVWNEFCDWYVEFSKPILHQPTFSAQQKNSTRSTLLAALGIILKLLHPIMPFITDTLWQSVKPHVPQEHASLMLSAYPQAEAQWVNPQAEEDVAWIKLIITAIRALRSDMQVSPATTLPMLYVRQGAAVDQARCLRNQAIVFALAKISAITWLEKNEAAPSSRNILAGHLEILIPLAGSIDLDAEIMRLHTALTQTYAEIERLQKKLSNAEFIAKAPPIIIQQERQKLTAYTQKAQQLAQQQAKIK